MLSRSLLALPLIGLLLFAMAIFGADTPATALLVSGGFLAIVLGVMRPGPLKRLSYTIWLALWGGAVVILGQTLGPVPGTALPDLAVLTAAAAIYLSVVMLASTSTGADQVGRLLSIALIIIGLISFLDFIATPELLYGREKAFHQDRLTASYLSANTAATFFGLATLFGLSGVLRIVSQIGDVGSLIDRFAKGGMLPLLVLIFSLTCLFLTGSRGGILATGIAAGIFVWWERRESESGIGWPVIAIVVGLLIGFITLASGSLLQERVVDLGTDDTGRSAMWRVGWEAWQAAPLFGHGFGRFEAAIAPYITAETAAILSQQGAAHNLLLQWLVQAGIVGTLGGIAIMVAAVLPLVKGLRTRKRRRTLMKMSAAMAVLVMVHGLLDYGLEIPAVTWWFAAYLGLGVSAAVADKTSVHQRRAARND